MAKRKASKPKAKVYTLTEEHRARLAPWAKRWIANAMHTGPYSDQEKADAITAMHGLYAAANMDPPPREIFAPSPICGAFAAGIASGVWWLRENPTKHQALFGRSLSEADIQVALYGACAVADGRNPIAGLSAPETYEAAYEATEDAMADATQEAMHEATLAATDAATLVATSAATRDATRDAVDEATYAATIAVTHAATIEATSAATYEATLEATRAATLAATAAATDDAMSEATRNAVDAATQEATHDATYEATSAATFEATSAATHGTVISFLLRCALRWNSLYNGGNQWSGWVAYLSFFRHVAELPIDYSKWQHYESAALVGPRFVHAKFWIVCARPDVLCTDEQNRPHCATGPSHRWPDGRELYYWRGTRIPKEWITAAGSVDPMLLLTHQNIEQRRCLAEIIGWTRLVEKLRPVTVDKHPNPEIGELLRIEPMPGEGEESVGQFLRVLCGTGRTFVLRCSPHVKTALEAQAELYGISAEQMRALEART